MLTLLLFTFFTTYDDPIWLCYIEQRSTLKQKNFYSDIINHCMREPYLTRDRATNAHETTHYIRWELRDGFYVGGNLICKIKEPKITIKQISENIPRKLRGNRFNLY